MKGLGRDFAARLLALVLSLGAANAFAQTAEPRVPPGADPGGVAVAFIGNGVDYTQPQVARRLARDGEGEIIGWDFVDNDRRPYRKPDCLEPRGDGATCYLPTEQVLLKSAGAARLVAFRAEGTRPQTVVEAIKRAGQTPARILLLGTDIEIAAAPGGAPRPSLAVEAAQRFPELLFVVAGTYIGASAAPANLLYVSSLSALTGGRATDLVVGLPLRPNEATPAAPEDDVPPELSAARVAALAARLLAAEPALGASMLKQRIVSLATPPPAGAASLLRHGWIQQPEIQFPGR